MSPDRVPESPEGIIETASVEAWIEGRSEEHGGPVQALFILYYDHREEHRRIRRLAGTLTPELMEELGRTIFDAVHFPDPPPDDAPDGPDAEDTPPSGPPGYFRIEVTADAAGATLRLRPSVSCAPVVMNREEMGRALVSAARAHALEGRAHVNMFVGITGRVEDVTTEDDGAPIQVRQVAAQIAGDFRFEPARIDGDPVAVWTRMPFTFRIVRE